MLCLGQIYILKPDSVKENLPLKGFIKHLRIALEEPFYFQSLDEELNSIWIDEKELEEFYWLHSEAELVQVMKIGFNYYKIVNNSSLEEI